MASRLFAFLFAALAIQGCVTYHRAPILPKSTALQLEGRSLADPRLRKFLAIDLGMHVEPGPSTVWDLGSLVGVGLYFNSDLRFARASAASTKAGIKQAGVWPNPTLIWSPEALYNARSAPGVFPWTLGFSLDLLVETAGKRGARIDQARQQSNAAILNVASAVWVVRSSVRKALIDLYSARITQEFLNRQSGIQQESLSLLEQRLNAGEISAPEVTLARIAADQAALQLQETQKLADEAKARLAAAMGVPASTLDTAQISFRGLEEIPSLSLGTARRIALVQRTDVLSELADYAATEAALRLEIAKQYPDIHLSPGYMYDQGLDRYNLGFSITLPVFDQNRAGIAVAEAKRKEAAARFLATQGKAVSEIDLAYASFNGARRKLRTADTLLVAQRKHQESVQSAFNVGAADRLQLLQSQLEVATAELSRASALIEAQTAVGLLEDALQHPAEADQLTGAVLRNILPK